MLEAKGAAEYGRSIPHPNGLAVAQPVGHDPGRQIDMRGSVFIGFEEVDVPQKEHEFRARPPMGNIAHVPPPLRDFLKILGDGVTVLLIPGPANDLPFVRPHSVGPADLGVSRVAHRPG